MKPDLEFDPPLVQHAVPLALMGRTRKRTFDRDLQRSIADSDSTRRDRAWRDLHSRWFGALGLADPARQSIREGGSALVGVTRWRIAPALSGRRSGAKLLLTSSGRYSVVVSVFPETLADRALALPFFRRELLRVADMLDPAFEYQPRLPSSPLGPPEDRRIRDRTSVLWQCSVEGRLTRQGKLPPACRNRSLAQFRILFPSLENRARECFERIFRGPRPLYSVFVSLATEPEVAFGLQRRSGLRQPRCPLCGHLVRDFAPDSASFPPRVDRAIRLDHPGWRAEMGVCLQCADVYRALAVRNPQGLPCAPSHRPQTLS